MVLEADDRREAEAVVVEDLMVKSGLVEWQLRGWRSAVGDLATIPEVGIP